MPRSLLPSLALLTGLGGCFLVTPTQSPDTAAGRGSGGNFTSNETKDRVREQEQFVFGSNAHDSLAQPEKDVKAALELSVGSGESITTLRKAKVKLLIEPVTDANGNAVGDNFVQLHAEGRKAATFAVEVSEMNARVLAFSVPAMSAGWQVATASFSTMTTASHMAGNRRDHGMRWKQEDYELVRRKLVEQRRAESLAAISIGMIAAYQAVVDGADPEALDVIAEESLKAFPLKPEVTIEEAREYVDHLGDNVAGAKQLYARQLRKTYGDDTYESQYKATIDAMFAQAEKSSAAKPAQPVAAQRYGAQPQNQEATATGVLSTTATANSDQMMSAAQNAIPGGSSVGHALGGVQAIRDQDAVGAMKAATNLVPAPGPVKAGLSIAATILDASQKAKKAKDKAKRPRRR